LWTGMGLHDRLGFFPRGILGTDCRGSAGILRLSRLLLPGPANGECTADAGTGATGTEIWRSAVGGEQSYSPADAVERLRNPALGALPNRIHESEGGGDRGVDCSRIHDRNRQLEQFPNARRA